MTGMITLHAAGISDTGCKRSHNEDRILVETSSGIFILADGMGGERCGELAAEIAVQTAGEYLLQTNKTDPDTWPFEYDSTLDIAQNRVMNGVRLANRRVWETCQTHRECQGMGTTLSTLVCTSDVATVGNVGDSRVYILRETRLSLLTRDDAVVTNLIESGKITPEEARIHPLRNVLTQAVGRAEDIAVQLIEFELRAKDLLLLCSDGLHGVIDDSMIKGILDQDKEPEAIAVDLVSMAKERGGPDNISCIVIACADL